MRLSAKKRRVRSTHGSRLLAGITSCTLLAAISACTTTPAVQQSFSFNRPASVDFVCLRVPVGADGKFPTTLSATGTEVTVFPATQCPTPTASTSEDFSPSAECSTGYCGNRLFALVTQADRGEVAIVNLHPRFNTGNVDTDPRVPGFTFIPAGSFASSLVVHPSGQVSYVAASGDRTITILDNRRLLAGTRFNLVDAAGAKIEITGLPSEPIDLALRSVGDPAQVALYVLLRDGTLRVYDITDPRVAPVMRSEVRVAQSISTPSDAGTDADVPDATAMDDAPEADADGDAPMMDASVMDVPDPTADGAMDGSSVATRAVVERLAVADDGRVFVSDRGLPIIHAFEPQMNGFSLVEVRPLNSGIGTTSIAVSPTLPSDRTQWVYAVTTGPQELIVLDSTYTNNAPAPTYGTLARPNAINDDPRCMTVPFDALRCPKIDPNFPHDRVPLRAPARAVGFVAVTGRSDTGQGRCDLSAPLVENCTSTLLPRLDVFRGVQAVVALANAQIQVVDLEDPDRNCAIRLGAAATRAFMRHIPRGGDTTQGPSVIGAPQLAINGGAANFGGPNPRIAALDGSMTTCEAANNYCIELPRQPQDATKIDPLQVRDATFTLRYEGQLPLRVTNAASFEMVSTGVMRMRTPGSRLCQLGALAGDKILLTNPSYYVDNNLRGDASVPVIDNPMCPADECRRLFGDPTVRCNREYTVLRATQDSLDFQIPTIGNSAGESCGLVNGVSAEASANEFAAKLACCYPQATRAEIRATGSWVVAAAPAGRPIEYEHDVVERNGECVEDPTIGARGRLTENVPYNAGPFRVRIASGSQPTARDTTIVFQTGGGYPQLVSSSGAPGAISMRFLCPADRMYIVDQSPSALREYSLGPFSATRSFN